MKTIPQLAEQAGICLDILDQAYPSEEVGIQIRRLPDDTEPRISAFVGAENTVFAHNIPDGTVLADAVISKAGDRSRAMMLKKRIAELTDELAKLGAK